MKPIKGHALLNEGAPYSDNGTRLSVWTVWGSPAGTGRAKCQCGALSELALPSVGARKAWHREHKLGIIKAATR